VTIGFAQSKSLAGGQVVLLPVELQEVQTLRILEKLNSFYLPGQYLAQAPRPPGRIWQVLVDRVFSGIIAGKVVQSGNWERTAN